MTGSGPRQTDTEPAPPETRTIQTHFYRLRSETVRFVSPPEQGGAVEVLGSELLIVTRSGRFVVMAPDGEFRHLDERVPMVESEEVDLPDEAFVFDILVRERSPGRFDLFVFHHFALAGCTRLQVSSTSLQQDGERVALGAWRAVFDAEPCVERGSGWNATGGPMLTDGPDHLLVVVAGHDAPHKVLLEALRNDDLHLGKVLRVEIRTGAAETLTRGHRTLQGLTRDAVGRLWSAEHGPRGGDELNLLEPGSDYGHPRVSYGLPDWYPGYPNPDEPVAGGRHDGFTWPVFAWAPSPGLSALVVNDARAFPLWDDDLLIASLNGTSYIEGVPGGRSLFRVRRRDRTIQYVERILLGAGPIRDLKFLPDGRLVLLSRNTVHFLSSTSEPIPPPCAATDLFGARCAQCHSLNQETHRAGPHLVGAVGRRAGRAEGFDGFSPALQALDRDWTPGDLEQYLADPQGFAPGTVKTRSVTPEEARQLAALISGGPDTVVGLRVRESDPQDEDGTISHGWRRLTPGWEYEVQIRRRDANGRVAFSEAVPAVTDGTGRFSLLWDAPAPDVCATWQFRLRMAGETQWRGWRGFSFR